MAEKYQVKLRRGRDKSILDWEIPSVAKTEKEKKLSWAEKYQENKSILGWELPRVLCSLDWGREKSILGSEIPSVAKTEKKKELFWAEKYQ